MKLPHSLVGLLAALCCLAGPTPIRAAGQVPSIQDARVELVLQESVAADPTTQLYIAEALAAM